MLFSYIAVEIGSRDRGSRTSRTPAPGGPFGPYWQDPCSGVGNYPWGGPPSSSGGRAVPGGGALGITDRHIGRARGSLKMNLYVQQMDK